jgi:serine/threonine protein kinase
MSSTEFAILCSVDHPNIIKTYDFHVDANSIALVQELFPAPTLKSIVRSAPTKRLLEAEASSLFAKLLQAIDYLHKRRIVHRDIKPANILVAKDCSDLKLIDFNTAHCLREGASFTPVGTKSYAAPEVILGESPSEANDIWAVGLCLHYMITGTVPPYQKAMATHANLGQSWLDVEHQGFCNTSSSCKQMLQRCLAWKKEFRPAAMTLLGDRFVSDSQPVAAVMHDTDVSIGIVFGSPGASSHVKPFCKEDNSKEPRSHRRRTWDLHSRVQNSP